MKCRYSACKFGGDVPKDIAIRDGNMYFHKECYDKREFKRNIQQYYIDNKKIFSQKDWNIALSRLVDKDNLDTGFIDFVAKRMIKDIKTPYNIMYYCKFDDLQKEYQNKVRDALGRQQLAEMRKIKIEDNSFEFEYNQVKPVKRYSIY